MAAIVNKSNSVHFYLDQENYTRFIPNALNKNLENLIYDILNLISKDYERVDFLSLEFYDDLRAHKYVEIIPACRRASLQIFVIAKSIAEVRKFRFPDIGKESSPITVKVNLIPFVSEEEKEEPGVNPLFCEYAEGYDESEVDYHESEMDYLD